MQDNRNQWIPPQNLIRIPEPNPLPKANPLPLPTQIQSPQPIQQPSVLPSTSASGMFFDFEDGNMTGWTSVDEPGHLLGEKGPSRWGIAEGPIAGKALVQTSNIWGDPEDVVALGTFLLYDLQEWGHFIMEFDIMARDNDGTGIVWGWKGRHNHYRFLTMIDPANPTGAPAEMRAPFSVIEKRIGDTPPYYQTLVRINKACYSQDFITRFRLEVAGGNFKVFSNNHLVVEASDSEYRGGKAGFTLYAHNNIFFDNVRFQPLLSYPAVAWGTTPVAWETTPVVWDTTPIVWDTNKIIW